MQNKLKELKKIAVGEIGKTEDSLQLEALRVRFLGKKGELTSVLAGLGELTNEEKPIIGKLSNEVKSAIAVALAEKKEALANAELALKIASEKIDITLPGRKIEYGHEHLLTKTIDEIKAIFTELGYDVAEGPDIEDEFHNFEALNILADHPSREMHDTFYMQDNKTLLRTHTSPVQIRLMENTAPPIKHIMPGRVYRCDSDVTHSPVFYQVEGLLVDCDITFGNLKGTLEYFLHQMFGPERKVRFRNSYFPFTEPSAEVDVECFMCKGSGCSLCKQTGWIEIMGCGMVDPNVFDAVKYDHKKYSGFAFGMGVERIAMLKYGIKDIRLLYGGDLRFLKQF